MKWNNWDQDLMREGELESIEKQTRQKETGCGEREGRRSLKREQIEGLIRTGDGLTVRKPVKLRAAQRERERGR